MSLFVLHGGIALHMIHPAAREQIAAGGSIAYMECRAALLHAHIMSTTQYLAVF